MKNVNRILIYKSDGSEIIDVSDHVQSLSLEKGSVEETGDIYADNPVQSVNITLKNTNEKQFSPHFEKGKMVFNQDYELTLNGGNEYNLPYSYIEQVVSLTDGYMAQMLGDKIYIDCFEGYELTGTIKLGITYIDTTVDNPLNHITGNVFSPLISIGNRVSWYRDMLKNTYEGYNITGNGTNQITIDTTKNPINVALMGVYVGARNYYSWLSENYFDILQDNYFQTAVGQMTSDFATITGFNKVGNTLTVTFNRVITSQENIILTVDYEEVISSTLKFDGYISEDPSSDIETCSFVCDDRTFDLKKAKLINSDDLRVYSTIGDTLETTEEKCQLFFSNNVATSSNLNYTQYFTLNEVIALYDGQNFKKATITALSSGSITVSPVVVTNPVTVFNGEYSASKIYDGGIPLPIFIQNCLNDKGLPYTVYNNNSYTFGILPKQTDMQQVDLHNYFQDVVLKTGNLLNFENVNGSFEYVLKKIPMDFDTPKYFINEDDILQGTNYGLRGKDVRTSWILKYQTKVGKDYKPVILVKDDFTLSPNTCTIGVERNIINIDEVFVVGDTVRINNQYYKIAQALTSNKYRLNRSVPKETLYKLYKSGEFSNKIGGVKIAQYELDNTSAIDTEAEAEDFTNRLLYQTKEPYAVYQIKLNADDYELNNFDTIEVTSPRLSLYNEKCFVQSVNESYSSGSNVLTITICKKQIIGKYKIKEMIAERGLNQIVTSNKQSTNEVFPPPQNLVALEPAIDDLQNYVVYSAISWDSMIGRSVIQWELQYKISTDDWLKAETITLNETSLKLVLKEQKLYDIRVRGVGKEQVKGEWSYTQVDASLFLIDNPIQNRTWYIRLFKGNDEVEYFNRFDLLGYTNQYLIDNIDTIEIVPNADKGSKTENYVNWCYDKYTVPSDESTTHVRSGLQLKITNKLGYATGKNLFFRNVINGYYLLEGDSKQVSGGYIGLNSYIDSQSFKNIDTEGTQVIFKMKKTGMGLVNWEEALGQARDIKNIKIQMDKSTDFTNGILSYFGVMSNGFTNYANSRTNYENIIVEFLNTNNTYSFAGFRGINNGIKMQSINGNIGFNTCINIKESKATNCYTGFFNSALLSKNSAENCTEKYNNCYSSLAQNATYLIATNGSDNVNGGFNV